VSGREQKAHTTIGQDTLLHGETLLVITTRDPQHISLKSAFNYSIGNWSRRGSRYLPFITKRVGVHFSRDTLLIERSQLALIVNLNKLLAASGRVGNIQLE
jgi:hypothetical protein